MNAEAVTLSTMADMRYRRLGNSGLAVSVVGIGCNNFGAKLDAAQTQNVVDTAIDEGLEIERKSPACHAGSMQCAIEISALTNLAMSTWECMYWRPCKGANRSDSTRQRQSGNCSVSADR